jgi:hypothetical protein
MKRIILFTCLFLLLIGSSRAESEGEKIVTGTVKDGYALLTDLTKIFEEITIKGSGLGSANERLNAVIIDAAATFLRRRSISFSTIASNACCLSTKSCCCRFTEKTRSGNRSSKKN